MIKINNQEKQGEPDIKKGKILKILVNFILCLPILVLLAIYFFGWVHYDMEPLAFGIIFGLPILFSVAISLGFGLYELNVKNNIKKCCYIILPVIFVFLMITTPLGDFMLHLRFYGEFLKQKEINPEIQRVNESTPYTEWRIKSNASQGFYIVFDPSDEIIKRDKSTDRCNKGWYDRVYKLEGHFYMLVINVPA